MLKNKLLTIILVLAAVLRLWHLGSIPPGLTPDEAALGYNTYSIIHTGRDEFGKFFPIIFKSFGDYKPGLYIYLDAPFVAALGLNEFSTRLPSALSGLLIIWFTYLICYVWFDKRTALLAAFVAAINPYLIYFSRGAWEANVSLMFTLLGVYLFLKAVYKPRFLIYSSIFFALTFLTYQGAKLSTTIVVVILIVVYWNEFKKIRLKYLIKSAIFGFIISVPIFLSLVNGNTYRLAIFSIFSYQRPTSEIQTYTDGYFNLFHSNQLNYLRMILSRWFNLYSGKFLFFEGDTANPIHTAPYQGVLFLNDLLLLPLGLFTVFKKKMKSGSLVIFLWLILAPFSAAISRDQTNAVRSLNTAIPLVIVVSFGLGIVAQWLNGRLGKWFTLSIVFGFYLVPFIYFLDAYFVHLPAHNSNFWRYGYKEAINYITPVESKYNSIVFEQSFNQPYIYFLFYDAGSQNQKYPPLIWQTQANLVDSQYKGDVGFQTKLGNIEFRQIDWSLLESSHNTLVISSPDKIPPNVLNDPQKFNVINQIKYMNGRDVAFNIIEIR